MTEFWPPSETSRQETARRIAENVFALCYSIGKPVADADAKEVATAIEKKAYTVASVESSTTTGSRPPKETLQAYVRKLASLVIEYIAAGSAYKHKVQTSTDALDLTGDREFLTKDTALEVLGPLLTGGAAVKRIKLSTKSFGSEAAAVAANAIGQSSASLTDVDLSDVIAGRPEAEALSALGIISTALSKLKLRRLDLSDNALGEKGVRACAPAFSTQEALESLAFQNVGCSINACRAVGELLTSTHHLRSFHFHNNMSDDEGAAAIGKVLARAPQMEDFRMASSRVGAIGGIALARGLTAGKQLVRLDLSDNPMTGDVAETLAAMLRDQPKLRVLNLNDTSLGDEGVTIIASALTQGPTDLEELELGLNEITPKGAQAVATMLAVKRKLTLLNLRENELEDRGAIWIAHGIANATALRTIDLTQNQIRRAGAVAIAKAVGNMQELTLLSLDENEISENGIELLKEALRASGKLSALGSLEENDAETEDEEEADVAVEGAEDDLVAAFAKSGIN